jgi:hypothetical protein
MKKLAKWKSSLRLASLSLLALFPGSCVANPQQQAKTEEPRNVVLTNAAWAAYESKDYKTAIAAAMRCVERFKKEADRDQTQLEKNHAEQPPTGRVTPEQKKAIFEQGVLNDVATCYWIAGHSAQILQQNDQAREAYRTAAKYTYARTYDKKQNLFWSPADDAADRIKDIPETKDKN